MNYDGLHDFIDGGRAKMQSGMNFKGAEDEFNDSLECKKFPSIILGSSPQVELYDETACWSEMSKLLAFQNCEGILPSSFGNEQVQESCTETWPPLSPALPNVTTSLLKEEESYEPSQLMALETIEKSDYSVTVKESSVKVGSESPLNAASIQLFLDRSINFIPGLSKRQCHQLESSGFNTVGTMSIK